MSTNGPPPPPPARRKHERYELVAQVQVPLVGEILILTLVNISTGGVLLKLDRQDLPEISLGTEVQVFLDVPTKDSDDMINLQGKAEIVRITAGSDTLAPTVALMWSSSDAEFALTLAEILEVSKEPPT